MIEELRELWRFRELLVTMVQRELRVRYKNSSLGFLWSFINPLVTTLVFTFVFGVLAGNGVSSYSAYILAAFLPFSFFQFSVLDSSQSILAALPLVKKIYFPRELLPLAAIISNFIHLLLGFLVFFGYLAVVWVLHPGTSPFQGSTWLLPILMAISFCLATGFGLLVSALNTFYEDVKFIATIGLNLVFYLCPVVYLSEMVAYSDVNQRSGGLLFKVYHLNPLAALSTAYRQALLAPPTYKIRDESFPAVHLKPEYLVWSAVFSIFVLIFGYHVFNRMKWRFVERP